MATTPYRQRDALARWPLRQMAGRFLLAIEEPVLREGRQSVLVADVTAYADQLQLNQGQIRNGRVVFGPGEAYAVISDEGPFGDEGRPRCARAPARRHRRPGTDRPNHRGGDGVVSGMYIDRINGNQTGWTEWARRRTGPLAGTLADIYAVRNGDYRRSLHEHEGHCDWLGIVSAHDTEEEAKAAMRERQWARWESRRGGRGIYEVIRFRDGTVVEHPDAMVTVTSAPTKDATHSWQLERQRMAAWEWAECGWPCFRWITHVEFTHPA